MKEELVIYDAQKAQVVPKGRNYIVSPFGDKQIELNGDKISEYQNIQTKKTALKEGF